MIDTVGAFVGGLGLFLLAVSMITDGLKLSAGTALKNIIARSTSTRGRAVASGILVTGVVQSSSAVTLATIGFVNAGLLTLPQSLGIVYGANVGTTMTGWLVAAMGFKIDVQGFALPLIGLGMAARLAGPSHRFGALGEALAGFGLFFIGVEFLQSAFGGMADQFDLTAMSVDGLTGLLLYTAIGFAMTLVTQSSSAAIALTLTAATGGVLAIDAAAAMVIGANVGTTSTAMFAVIGATPNAKRVAAAHVAFNVLTGAVAIAVLPLMLRLVGMSSDALGLAHVPAVALALFHTTFNLLGVALVWPLTDRLAAFLNARFTSHAETLGRPVYLDSNIVVTPLLGLDALRLELTRMGALSREHAVQAVKTMRPSAMLEEHASALAALTDTVEGFVVKLERQRLPQDFSERLPLALRINNYIEEVTQLAQEVAVRGSDVEAIAHGRLKDAISAFTDQVSDVIRRCDPSASGYSPTELAERYQNLRAAWKDLKSNLLSAASRGDIPVSGLNAALDRLRSCLRIAEQTTKAAERSLELSAQFSDAADDSQATSKRI